MSAPRSFCSLEGAHALSPNVCALLHPGVLPEALNEYPELGAFYKVLAYTHDREGVQYATMLEGRKYPFTGAASPCPEVAIGRLLQWGMLEKSARRHRDPRLSRHVEGLMREAGNLGEAGGDGGEHVLDLTPGELRCHSPRVASGGVRVSQP